MSAKGVWKHEEAALVLIDYQKEMFDGLRSETSGELVDLNVRLLIQAARAFGMPVVLSTVGVEMGVNQPTRQSILDALPGVKVIVFGALYTEICLAFPVVDAMKDGYDAAFVVDAVGGLSQLAHRTAIERLTAAGATPTTALAMVTELFRDWKSPVAGKAREILKTYLTEVKQVK